MSLKLDGIAPIADLYRLLHNIEETKRNEVRENEYKNYKKQLLYNQIENDDQMRADKRNQREDLMSTSTFNVKSIMPKVKSLVADKQFLASGNASQSVMGDSTFSAKGGRRTRRHKKRSAHKRSGHKRSGKRSGRKSSRR
jgi:hypothetical protein